MTLGAPPGRISDPRIRRAVGVFGLASVAVAVAAMAIDPVASTRSVPSASGPVLTVRRAPVVLQIALGRQNLAKALDLVASDPEFAAARSSSCVHVVIDLHSGGNQIRFDLCASFHPIDNPDQRPVVDEVRIQ